MQGLAFYNPIAAAVYFICAAGVAMFTINPLLLALSCAGALSFDIALRGLRGRQGRLPLFILFAVMALINPLTHHNGATVLFVMNDNPVTLEALIYGVNASAMIIGVLFWFRSFSRIMTSDRLLYLFGRLSPKAALILSMALRYVPLFGRQAKRINSAQKALGLYKDDNAIDALRGGLHVFSALVTWALENGITTADSMSARGYGVSRRTSYAPFRFGRADACLTLLCVLLAGAVCAGLASGALAFRYYPRIVSAPLSPLACVSYAAYACLAALPTILEIGESLKWRCLKSKT